MSDKKPTLLSGGNPQIAKGEGEGPVRAYLDAVPESRRGICRRLDELIVGALPDVRKAVKWNSPFYGAPGASGWFASFHVFTRYVKLTFFQGALLTPPPPGGTEKSGQGRWIDIHVGDEIDEAQLTEWISQAARLPGWDPSKR
ncbi:MAG TPA: DUF1801 domain-containing protein [Caulobacteraceae bacterium]|nr:DUF1801 domain-containing protein [Caulobacteraceae bacterium]